MASINPGLIADLALVLGVAGPTGLVARRAGFPAVLGYLGAGLVVGPYLPIPLFADPARVATLSDLGVVLVMFAVGLEFRVQRFLKILPTCGISAAAQMGTLAWLGYTLGQIMGWTPVERLFLAGCLAISSTMVASRVLEEEHAEQGVRELSLGILVLQDVVAIALLTALTVVASGGSVEPGPLLLVTTEVIGLLVLAVAAGMLLVPRMVRAAASAGSDEALLVMACGICFVLAYLAQLLGYSVALGAFLAGVLVAESGDRSRVEHLIVPVKNLFAAVFFVSIGMSVDPRLVLAHLDLTLLLVGVVILGQLGSLTLGGLLSGQGLTRSVATGLALGQVGEFSFLLAGIGTTAGVLRPAFLPAMIATGVVTAWTTPFLLRRAAGVTARIESWMPHRIRAFVSLWTTWVGRARRSPDAPRSRLRKVIGALVLDALGIGACALAALLWWPRAGGNPSTAPLAWIAALATLPLLLGLLRNTWLLGTSLVEVLLPPPGEDAGEAPEAARDLMQALAPLLVLVGLGLPAAGLLRPLLPAPVLVPALLLLAIPITARLWRRSGRVDEQVNSGVESVLRRLAAESREDRPVAHAALPLPAELGLGELGTARVRADGEAVGRTLRDLAIRVRTGATVLAVRRGEDLHPLPEGAWVLEAGDVVALAGAPLAREHAARLLEAPRSEATVEEEPDAE